MNPASRIGRTTGSRQQPRRFPSWLVTALVFAVLTLALFGAAALTPQSSADRTQAGLASTGEAVAAYLRAEGRQFRHLDVRPAGSYNCMATRYGLWCGYEPPDAIVTVEIWSPEQRLWLEEQAVLDGAVLGAAPSIGIWRLTPTGQTSSDPPLKLYLPVNPYLPATGNSSSYGPYGPSNPAPTPPGTPTPAARP